MIRKMVVTIKITSAMVIILFDKDDNIRSHHSADDNNGYIMMITIVRNSKIFAMLMIHYNQFRNTVIVLQNYKSEKKET